MLVGCRIDFFFFSSTVRMISTLETFDVSYRIESVFFACAHSLLRSKRPLHRHAAAAAPAVAAISFDFFSVLSH